jgi:uncharacterized protein (DUF1501 family)
MANTAKAVNYTAEQTGELIARFTAGESVEALAIAFGKTTRSIVAKLSREGHYKAKERVSKSGEAVVKKDALSDQLAALAGLTEAEADSLTKANKTALAKLIKALS